MVPVRSLTAMPIRLDPEIDAERPHRVTGSPVAAACRDAQRLVEPVGVLAAGRGDVALAAATAADGLGRVLDEVAGDLARRGVTAATSDTPPVSLMPPSTTIVDAGLLAHGDGEFAQVARARARRPG